LVAIDYILSDNAARYQFFTQEFTWKPGFRQVFAEPACRHPFPAGIHRIGIGTRPDGI
jgi:hypothetical protein